MRLLTVLITSGTGVVSGLTAILGNNNLKNSLIVNEDSEKPLKKEKENKLIEKQPLKKQVKEIKVKENMKGEYLLFDQNGRELCGTGTTGGNIYEIKGIDCNKKGMNNDLKEHEKISKLGMKVNDKHDLNWAIGLLKIVGGSKVGGGKGEIKSGNFPECQLFLNYINDEETKSEKLVIGCYKKD